MWIPMLLLLHLLLAGPTPALAGNRHVITFRSQTLSPSTLRWDPSAQHFLVGSLRRPSITAVSDAGILDTIVEDHLLPPNSSFPSIAVDPVRRRLLAVVSGASSSPHLAAYDLSSPRPHRRIFLSPLSSDVTDDPSDLAVDPATGEAYVTSSTSNLIWKVDLEGSPSILSRSQIYGREGVSGLAGIAYNSKGYLLAVQTRTGRVFKVDPEGGISRLVLMRKAVAGAEGIDMRADGAAVVFSGETAWILKSEDGWGEAAVYDEIAVERGRRVRGVAVREGKRVSLLYGENEEEEKGRMGRGGGGEREGILGIEEVESEREMEGEWVIGLVLIGLGLAYFTYWRVQMRSLVSNMNKKVR